jgi:heme ABC exporter ATP-binding subunit CcmA
MQEAVQTEGLRRLFGERPALDGVDLRLAAGETLLVLGPNGAGKTTLLRVLATLLRPSGGHATVLGCSLPGEAWRLRGRIGYLGHEPLLYRELTGRENLRFHARLHGIEAGAAEARVGILLERMAIERRADERTSQLSAGMRQRLAICRCLLHEPDLLLLDEPEAHLDSEGRALAQQLFADREGRSAVIATHEPERILAQADQALVLGPAGTPVRVCRAADLAPEEARAAVAGVPA